MRRFLWLSPILLGLATAAPSSATSCLTFDGDLTHRDIAIFGTPISVREVKGPWIQRGDELHQLVHHVFTVLIEKRWKGPSGQSSIEISEHAHTLTRPVPTPTLQPTSTATLAPGRLGTIGGPRTHGFIITSGGASLKVGREPYVILADVDDDRTITTNACLTEPESRAAPWLQKLGPPL